MKTFKSKTIKATVTEFSDICISVDDVEFDASIIISNKRTARALGKWLLKVTEPAKNLPNSEPRVGTKVTVTASVDHGMYLNRPGVITGIDCSGTWPYGVDVTMPDGRVESTILARDEFKVRE